LKNLNKNNHELVALPDFGKPVPGTVLRVLPAVPPQGNVFYPEPRLLGFGSNIVVFYPDDAIGMG